MNVLISGATGFVGSALYVKYKKQGHNVKTLSRKGWDEMGGSIQWNPMTGEINKDALEGLDAVVHLAGENIASERWTEQKKKRLLESRVQGTTLLAQTLASLKTPPRVFVSASAIGFYGNRAQERLDENSPPSGDFLSQVCQQWEKAALIVKEKDIRLVTLRFGMILGKNGGALKKMLLPFKLGFGGVFGRGKQIMSWIALDDVLGIIDFAINNNIEGVFNAVAPTPVSNKEFTEVLGRILCRPTFMAVPAAGARLLMGEMADALLLSSTNADSSKLVKAGYVFMAPEIQQALRSILGKKEMES